MSPHQIDTLIRTDRELITGIVPEGANVLDLGCGDGSLLAMLTEEKNVVGHGVEIDEENIIRCLERGLSVCQWDLDDGLRDFPDDRYEYVILNQTLQVIKRPAQILNEMLRVGRYGIVGFPNFAHWRIRLWLSGRGSMPKTGALPFEWYETPNIHLLTVRDFREYCMKEGIAVIRADYFMFGRWRRSPLVRLPANLFAVNAVFVITRE